MESQQLFRDELKYEADKSAIKSLEKFGKHPNERINYSSKIYKFNSNNVKQERVLVITAKWIFNMKGKGRINNMKGLETIWGKSGEFQSLILVILWLCLRDEGRLEQMFKEISRWEAWLESHYPIPVGNSCSIFQSSTTTGLKRLKKGEATSSLFWTPFSEEAIQKQKASPFSILTPKPWRKTPQLKPTRKRG